MKLVVFERRAEGDALRGYRRAPHGRTSMGAAALGFETLEGVTQGQRRIGVLLDAENAADTVVDLNRALAVKLAAEDAGAPEAEADSLLPPQIALFLRRLPDSLAAARAALAFVVRSVDRYDAPDLRAAGAVLPRRVVRLVAPVQPGKLVGVLGAQDAEEPPLSLVAPSAVGGPEDEVRLPPHGDLAVSAQLAAVIGRRARGVAPEQALDCIAGYCVAACFRAEGAAAPIGPIRHSGDGFVPLGPTVVTSDEAPDPHDLRVELRVSGRRQQASHTKELPLPIHELVARASQIMTLEPGDVLLSGEPRSAAAPAAPLRDGDVVEVEIESLGRLSLYLRGHAPDA